MDVRVITLAASVFLASRLLVIPAPQTGVPFTPLATVTAVLTEALNPATPDAAAPVATPTLVPVFPADLMPIVPVALVTATQDTKSAMVPVYLIHPAAADALLTKPAKTVAA